MRYVLRLFHIPVLSVTVEYPAEEAAVDSSHIEGGSAHNFERDMNPISPDDRYDWEWEDKRGFGFG